MNWRGFIICCVISQSALAAKVAVDANVTFISPLNMAVDTPLSFGLLSEDMSVGAIVDLSADGSMSGSDYISGASPAQLSIQADHTRTIDLEVGNFSGSHADQFLLINPSCQWAGSPPSACGVGEAYLLSTSGDTPESLSIGMSLQAVDVSSGSYSESFDVTAVYQ